jgi:hypothetical protein
VRALICLQKSIFFILAPLDIKPIVTYKPHDTRLYDWGGIVFNKSNRTLTRLQPMKRLLVSTLVLLTLLTTAPAPRAAEEVPYTEGSVFEIAFIRTLPGGFDAYMKFLQTEWKPVNEAAKKEGLILSYEVGVSQPANKDDWDVMLVIEYKNMAALDGLDEKMRDVSEKVAGTSAKQEERSKDRNKIRDIIGTKLVRQLKLK